MKRIMEWENIDKGDIGFYCSDQPVGKIISALTHSERLENLGYKTPSHALIFIGDGKIIEALAEVYKSSTDKVSGIGGSTQIRSSEDYKKDFEDGNLFVFRPSDKYGYLITAVDLFVKEYNGKKYGVKQILGFIPVLILRAIGIVAPNLFPQHYVCSEDVLIYLRMVYDNFRGSLYVELDELDWVWKLNKETADPALLMLFSITNGKGKYGKYLKKFLR